MKSVKGATIIFYPRSYNKRGDTSMHSMVGMTSEGDLINVKLRLDEKYLKMDNPPSVVEFSRTDFKAKMVCIASDDNGPEKPEGMLLLSKCVKEGRDRSRNLDVFIARWADVIKSDATSEDPVQGISRVLIQVESTQVKKIRALKEKARQRGDDKEVAALQDQIDDPINWSYPVIVYHPKELESFSSGDVKSFRETGAKLIDRFCDRGLVGGVAVRAINPYGQVIKESYLECQSRYIVTEERNQTGFETMESLLEDWPEKYDEDVTKWELFPIQRINAGPYANKQSGASGRYDFIQRTYYSEGRPRVCLGLSRITHYEQSRTTLLSKHFTLSEPIGDPARLDASSSLSMTFAGEGLKLAHINRDEPIVERKDSVLSMSDYRPRAMWLITDEEVPIFEAEKEGIEAESADIDVTDEDSTNKQPQDIQKGAQEINEQEHVDEVVGDSEADSEEEESINESTQADSSDDEAEDLELDFQDVEYEEEDADASIDEGSLPEGVFAFESEQPLTDPAVLAEELAALPPISGKGASDEEGSAETKGLDADDDVPADPADDDLAKDKEADPDREPVDSAEGSLESDISNEKPADTDAPLTGLAAFMAKKKSD